MAGKQENARRLGRPVAQASEILDQHILATAMRLFTEQGYAGTSIEQIAKAAGTGKTTIYRRYPSKEPLFQAVVNLLAETLLDRAVLAETSSPDPMIALRSACRARLDLASTPGVVAVYRVIIAEAHRFPTIIANVRADALDPYDDVILRLLKASRDKGQIREDTSFEEIRRALTGLCTGWAVQEALMGRQGLADKAERDAFFDCAWDLFLRGIR
ncbi:TetR/AcrR family transcriptional regulator [Beijerinckia sp. L45]|uniref:TetR/AcrR family transcriptional regulator n=1 Tax=Beijerinckia sp. L45 TaxID=1641855 RepID=UPI00131C664B|nr:TetR/AcrR family transcriptional regulator [Beijerinckia sp. L45]